MLPASLCLKAVRLILLISLVFVLASIYPVSAQESGRGASAEDGEMRFSSAHTGNAAEWTVAEGRITANTPRAFRKWMQQNPPRFVYLHSPGGDLWGGIQLGVLFRQHGYMTAVGQTTKSASEYTTKPGQCVSACAYAFLGGIERTAKGGEIGFHQFYNPALLQETISSHEAAASISSTQATVGILALYLKTMGIDGEVLFLAASKGPNGMEFPSEPDLQRLRIVNSGIRIIDPWTIEPVAGGAVVATRIQTGVLQEERIALHCSKQLPGRVIVRGAWRNQLERLTLQESQERSSYLRNSIFGSSLAIGRREIRSHPQTSGLLDARVDNDGTYRFVFSISAEEYSRGLNEGFTISIDVPRSLGSRYTISPPLPGLRERMGIAFRACI